MTDIEGDFVPFDYGWRVGQPDKLPDNCAVLRMGENDDNTIVLNGDIGLDNDDCDLEYNFICQKQMAVKTNGKLDLRYNYGFVTNTSMCD